ncbi:hypothetical protein J1614_003869, partial [Plenodomus biglobosus]
MPCLHRDRDDLILPVASPARDEPVDGEVYYRMEPTWSAHLHNSGDEPEMRKRTSEVYQGGALGRRDGSTTASNFILQFDMPMTPSSSSRGGENAFPTKKRKRLRTDGMY